MAGLDHLPQLPLMLAGVPRAFADLLREIGIPTAPLPKVALTASGTGRFVLYDSRSSSSTQRATRASRQGLEAIDLASVAPEFGERAAAWDTQGAAAAAAHATARRTIDLLKLELESRGGVWLRLADYPFPYQSALSIAVEHAAELPEFIDFAEAFPGRITHLVSSRLESDALARLASAGREDLGWHLGTEAFEFSARKTLAAWASRLERFNAAGLAVRGLAIPDRSLLLPPRSSLRELGFTFSTQPFAGTACYAEPALRGGQQSCWMHFGTTSLADARQAGFAVVPAANRTSAGSPVLPIDDSRPEAACYRIDANHVLGPDPAHPETHAAARRHEWMVEWVREHYQSGHPMLLQENTARPALFSELQALTGHAARCSLLWQTTFGELTRWWKLRRQMELQVWRRNEEYEIHASGDFAYFPWSIDIWRGAHLATIPLKQPVLNIRDDGLVFLRAQNKGPAGFTVPNPGLLERTFPRNKERLPAA